MTRTIKTTGDLNRRAILLRLSAASLAGVGLSFAALATQSNGGSGQGKSGKLFPKLSHEVSKATQIKIIAPTTQFELAKVAGKWVAPISDSYAVADEPLRVLIKALSDMRFVRALPPPTEQEASASQIDPRKGGDGVWLTVGTEDQRPLVTLILAKRGDQTWVQLGDDATLYEVTSADWPSFSDISTWLDLPRFDIAPERIATISLSRPGQAALEIVRRPDGGFAPVGGTASASINDIALLLGRLAFQDAQRQAGINGSPNFTHETSLKSGLIIALDGYQSAGRDWVKVRIDASQAATSEEGARLAAQTTGWAYEIPTKLSTLLSTPTALLLQAEL